MLRSAVDYERSNVRLVIFRISTRKDHGNEHHRDVGFAGRTDGVRRQGTLGGMGRLRAPVGGRRRPGRAGRLATSGRSRGRQRRPARPRPAAAFDGADDRDAALVLAWFLLPTALRVRRRLGLADDRVDEVLAAQLWVEVRGLPWRRPHWVAAKVAGQLREGVLLDCGAPTHHMPHRLSTVSMGPVDPADDRLVEDEDPAAELAELLAWACAEDVITDEDRELLVSLIEAAKRLQADGHAREGGVAGLSSRQLSAVVAQEWGVCARTVRRRTARCVAALSEAAGEYLNALC